MILTGDCRSQQVRVPRGDWVETLAFPRWGRGLTVQMWFKLYPF